MFIGTFRSLPYRNNLDEDGFIEFKLHHDELLIENSGDPGGYIRRLIGINCGLLCREHGMPKEMWTFEVARKLRKLTNLPNAFNFKEPDL